MLTELFSVHVKDVVTEWSYALAGFLVSTLFGVSPRTILAMFHIANVFLSGFPFFFSTEVLHSIMKCKSVTSSSI